jgi:hypothetical protein
MKKLILLLCLILSSCYVQELPNGPNEHSGDIIIVPPPNGTGTTNQSLVGQTWVVTNYRIGQMGQILPKNDTIRFLTPTTYKYNNYQTTYSLYLTGSGYNLTLNYTPWGNLSGNINDYNITSGQIVGTRFVDISVGSSNTTEYYLWMNKI